MKGKSNFQHFKEVYLNLHKNIKKFKYHLEKYKFSIPERNLLKAYYAFKHNNHAEVFSLLKVSPYNEPFLEGVRLLILGCSHNNRGNYEFAVEHIEKSIPYFSFVEDQHFYISARTTMIIISANRGQREIAERYMSDIEFINVNSLESIQSKYNIVQAKLVYLELINDPKGVIETIDKLVDENELFDHEYFKASFHLIKFYALVSTHQFEHAKRVLDKYKTCSRFMVRVNYKYLKTLLYHITDDQPVYAYEADYEGYSEQFHKVIVIKHLSQGEVKEAKKYWSELQKHNPELYQDDFKYKFDDNIFYMALAKHPKVEKEESVDLDKLKSIKTNLEKLAYLLGNHESLSKYDLVEYIWEVEWDDKQDRKLRKLVSQARTKLGLDIEANSGSYSQKNLLK